ncbi:MAG: dethiobiotin synthase [Candidatus Obscuribacterales bacterium]|nr:dethiobiotin synthase [Candidatus Obscuribacterales bacterium]
MRRTNPSGLIIAGTGSGCGKTVLATGIAATLQEEGLKLRAIKPISLGTAHEAKPEYAFLATIANTPLDYQVQFADKPGALKPSQFQSAVKTAISGTDPVVVELPGSSATPLCLSEGTGNGWQDSADFARELNWPVILVSKLTSDSFEQLALHATYMINKGVELLGVATVMTEADCKAPAAVHHSLSWEMALAEKIRSPYLGCLAHSQSISIAKTNQGNLIRTTSDALDLLPIIKAISLRVAI